MKLIFVIFFVLAVSPHFTASKASKKYPRFNEVQLVGVHGSYHVMPRESLRNILKVYLPQAESAWYYTHRPLNELLNAGIRSFQLNVFYDPNGGLYQNRAGLRLVGEPTKSSNEALSKPGYKVLHIQDIDFETTCYTFKACISQIYSWSVAHPHHIPITIKLVVSYRSMRELGGDQAATILPDAAVPLPVTNVSLQALEDEILSVIPKSRIIKPDNVRRKKYALSKSIQLFGWPTLNKLSGKILFAIVGDVAIDAYRKTSPDLKKKLMFTAPSRAGTRDAVFVTVEPPSAITNTTVSALLSKNIIVWALADHDTVEARSNNVVPRDTALASGVQIIHTDYPVCEAPNLFGTEYAVGLPGNKLIRCNPAFKRANCKTSSLTEPLF